MLRSIAAGGAAVAAPSVLAACSTDSSGGGSVSNQGKKLAPWPTYTAAPVPRPDLAPSAEGVQPGYTRYPEKLVKAVADKPGKGETIHVICITYGTPPKPATQNKYWAAMNEALGVDVRFTVVPDADFNAKYSTLVAGDELPDIIAIGGGHTVPRQAQFVQSRCADLSEFLSGDAVKDYPNLANIPTYAWQGMGRISGRIYGVPIERPKPSETIFINKDAYDRAGYRPGMSAADFAGVVKDASGDKHWALGSSQQTVYGHKTHALWHGAPNGWQIKGGKATDMWGTDEFTAMLEYLSARKKDGAFYPQADSTSTVDIKTLFYNKTLYSIADGFASLIAAFNTIGDQYPIDLLTPYSVPGAETAYQGSTGYFGASYLKKTSKSRTKLLLRVLDYLAAPFGTEEFQLMHYGVEDVHFKRDKDNNPIATKLGQTENKVNVPFGYLGDAPGVLYLPGGADLVKRVHTWEQKVVPLMKSNDSAGLVSDTNTKKGATMGQYLADNVTSVISGRKKVSDWPAIYKKWRDMGGAQVAEEYAKEYEAVH